MFAQGGPKVIIKIKLKKTSYFHNFILFSSKNEGVVGFYSTNATRFLNSLSVGYDGVWKQSCVYRKVTGACHLQIVYHNHTRTIHLYKRKLFECIYYLWGIC